MVEATTTPTDNELQITRNVLAWLAAYLVEDNPEARVSIEALKAAQVEIPTSIAELEGLG